MRRSVEFIFRLLLTFTATTCVLNASTTDGLLIYYRFEGNGRNEASTSFDLIPNSTSFGVGLTDQSLIFTDGNARAATFESIPISGNQSRTISVWLYLESFFEQRRALGWGTVDAPGDLSSIVVQADGRIIFHCHDRDVDSVPGLIQLGKWQHVAFVYDGSLTNSKIYLDGVQVKLQQAGTVGAADTINTTANTPLRLGYDPFLPNNDWNRGWQGKLDEIRIYNRALTTEEVQSVYSDITSPSGSILSIQKAIELQISSKVGETYQIQTSTDLQTWSNLDTPIIGTGDVVRVFKPQNGQKLYYRIKIVSKP